MFFGISEIGTPPPILKKGGGCLQRIRYVRHLQPRFLAELDNEVILSGNKQEEDVETRLDVEESRFPVHSLSCESQADVMLFVGKLHRAHLFQIDSDLVLSDATATQGSRSS